jgi:predicted exporter
MERLRAAASGIDGVGFIDPATDYSRLLRTYRQAAVMLIAVSALLMIGALALRYRLRGALRVMSPPIAAIALTPGLLALAGHGFSFFDAMALVLVLAIGVDYAIFCAEAPDSRKPVTLIAITLAAFSTLLSFGLLAFSSTAAVQAFGATMMCGIALVFLFSPFAAGVRRGAADVS